MKTCKLFYVKPKHHGTELACPEAEHLTSVFKEYYGGLSRERLAPCASPRPPAAWSWAGGPGAQRRLKKKIK